MDLRVSRQAGPHYLTNFVAGVFPANLPRKLRPFRPWSNEAHVTGEDVPELRQSIETGAAEVVTQPGASWIAGHRPDGAQVAFCLGSHGAEFDNREWPAVEPDSCLTVQRRPPVAQPDNDRDECQ